MYKKILLSLSLSIATLIASAQYSQNFSGIAAASFSTKTVGSGTWSVAAATAASMTQASIDGLTPTSALVNVFSPTTGWVLLKTTTDTFAVSTSYYSPAGISNDWLVTPQITVPNGSNLYLTWEAAASNSQYPDGYKVMIGSTANPASMTTVLTTISAENNAWTKRAINISSYAGQMVYIAFVNNSNDMELLYLDDIKVESINGYDAELTSVSMKRFAKTNSDVTITGKVKNNGLPLTSMVINWNDGSGNKTANITGLNLAPYSTYSFTHTVPFNKANADEFNLSVNVASINGGQAETSTTNNSKTGVISTVSSDVKRYVLIEEGTGTWCGWCPRGAVAMDSLTKKYSDLLGIAVHNGDPMTVTNYDDSANFSGFPGCNVDRTILGGSVSATLFEQYYQTRKAEVAPVNLDKSTFSASGNSITVRVVGEFKTKISNVRLAAIVVEDGVKGTTTGYNQTNYYAGGSNGVMGGYETKANPVPAASMVYNHVGRALLGGYAGQTGSVTLPATDNSTANYTFNYTVPSGSVVGKTSIIVVAIEQSTGQILNAFKAKWPTSISNVNTDQMDLNIYPNPANGKVNVAFDVTEKSDMNVQIYSLYGQLIKSYSIDGAKGPQNVSFDVEELASGQYLMTVSNSKYSTTKHFNVIK